MRIDRYIDEIAVERARLGDLSVNLTRWELAAAFDYLNSHGYSARQIATILGVSVRAVFRWRAGRVPQSRFTFGPLAERRGLSQERVA